MRNHPVIHLLMAAGLVLLAAPSAIGQSTPTADEKFITATRNYALMHRRIEQSLGPIQITAVAADLLANVNAMAAAIRMERAGARQGDLFTPELSVVLRIRIADALAAHGLVPADLAADEIPEGINRQSLMLRVGGPVPWAVGSTMLSCVLDVLPALPPELQYRFVFRDLALVDVHANIVVDILPGALADTEF